MSNGETLSEQTSGWWADDGGAPQHYPEAATAEEAARLYVEEGCFDADGMASTTWIRVWTWPDDDRDDVETHTIAVHPRAPQCGGGDEHEWCSPHGLVGGLRENPGVHGHGGGVVMTEVCARCGAYRVRDTWAQDPATGELVGESVTYREPDDASLAWIADSEDSGE